MTTYKDLKSAKYIESIINFAENIKGKEKFEVHWSTNLSQAQNLTALKLEKIQYLGNNIAEGGS